MGDSRQLPPTSFFDKLVDIEEEFNEESPEYIVEMESILNLCKTSLPSKTLRWHYRSRHESLIAVSNREFYDNKLMVYPSPMKESNRLGLKLIHLTHTRYDRGRSRTNREEAKAVANHVAEHFSQYPEKSLMVGTFSVAQQIAIQDEIEKIRDAHPELEFFFNRTDGENFAVKNLETIQGDERDVVFVSIGYGIDETGRLSSNFGPLNRDGGERRLNVLVTRAREKCVVFSNFRSIDLDLVKSEARGVRILQSFLHYAEHGDFPLSTTYQEDTESPFETDVFEFLKSKGYMIHPQVGCAGFRIDLGVVDPKIPGKYVLGIECDGAMYHSSPVARDRDKIRQRILEDLGWNLYRIWSTDWYRNPAESENALLSAVNSALMVDAAEIIDAK
jgi:very-short-patch-repair endonuclease